jgi:hypothetical protein
MSRTRRQWGEDSTVRVELTAGASITLAFKGNLFDLSAAERTLIADLSNTLQRFGADAKEKGPVLAKEAQHA